jgi:hypothetical protein
MEARGIGRFNMPIIPLATPEALPATLDNFQASFLRSQATQSWPVDAVRDLLPYCTVNTPLSRDSAGILSANSPSFRDILDEIATEEGQGRIYSTIEQMDAGGFVQFWTHEFAMA